MTDSDVERVARAVMLILWRQEQYNGVDADFDRYRAGMPDSMGGRVERYEAQALDIARAALAATPLQETAFLVATVSQDARIIGIDHCTDADWHEVLSAHIALRDRLNERIAEQERCPFKPVSATPMAKMREAGTRLALAAGALNIALDGQEQYRQQRQAVLDALKDFAALTGEAP